MATISRFEDIQSWSMARELTKRVYSASNRGTFARDFGLKDQIRRAAVSVMSNIAEGFERGGNKEFIRFLFIAKASCGELRSQLYVASDQGYLEESEFDNLHELAVNTSRAISGFINYLVEHPTKGTKQSSEAPCFEEL